MLVNKTGFYHTDFGINCQDYGFDTPIIKGVADGCSQCTHSEVGAKLFCEFKSKNRSNKSIFDLLTNMFIGIDIDRTKMVLDYLLFTSLYVEESNNYFYATVCGDGYIIKQKHDNTIDYVKIDNGEYPMYFGYNYVDQNRLIKPVGKISEDCYAFSKEEYKAIGVATDGLSYILNSHCKEEFEKALIARKDVTIKRMFNREYRKHILKNNGVTILDPIANFHDDFTIVI